MFTPEERQWIEDQITSLAMSAVRIADAIERLSPANEITVLPQLPPDEAREAELSDLAEARDMYAAEETLAVVEMLEGKGAAIPAKVYEKLGMTPPTPPPTAPTKDALEAPQPGAGAESEP